MCLCARAYCSWCVCSKAPVSCGLALRDAVAPCALAFEQRLRHGLLAAKGQPALCGQLIRQPLQQRLLLLVLLRLHQRVERGKKLLGLVGVLVAA